MDIAPYELNSAVRRRILGYRGAKVWIDVSEETKSLAPLPHRSAQRVFSWAVYAGSGSLLTSLLLGLVNSGLSDTAGWTVVGLGGALGLGGGLVLETFTKKQILIERVTADEIALASGGAADDLLRDYLGIVRHLLSLPTPTDKAEESSIRRALVSLGAALDKLPPRPGDAMQADPAALRDGAAQLTRQAQAEADGVVAASLERQANALRRRAATVARAATLLRRNQTLRDEVSAQVQAFRTSLAAAQINGRGGQAGADFAALAESVAQVAHEADALADARAELEAALAPAPVAREAAPLRAG